ncbi:MAG: arsenate reductase ArsC [Candidatus Riflebacteria bacterium]|nr:arsenate reductase ArsC [Candidatus Riflebacteria bacterium]
MTRKRVLFLCTGNSCRSQMAEGWLRHLKGDQYEAFSAGMAIHGMNSYAVQVMQEAGVDISGHRSKLLSEFAGQQFDLVVTVCSKASESCPLFPGKTRVVHVPFDDPPSLAAELTDDEQILNCYRRVRDEIAGLIRNIEKAGG